MVFYSGEPSNALSYDEGEAYRGRKTGFGENFSTSFERQKTNDSSLGFEREIGNRFREIRPMLEEAGIPLPEELRETGDLLEGTLLDSRGTYDRQDLSLGGAAQIRLKGEESSWIADLRARNISGPLAEMDKRIAEWNAANPDKTPLPDFNTVIRDAQSRMQELETRSEDVSRRAGFWGSAAGFVGEMAGSFTMNDPLNVASLFFGVGEARIAVQGAKGLLMRAGAEGALGAATETVNQFVGVTRNRELAGLEKQDVLLNVAAAGLGGAGFSAGMEVGGKLVGKMAERIARTSKYRQFEAKVSPKRAEARALSDTLGVDLGTARKQLDEGRTLPSDQEVISRVEESGVPLNVEERSALYDLKEHVRRTEANPYGAGRAAEARWELELENARRQIEGEPLIPVPETQRLSEVPGEPLRYRVPDDLRDIGDAKLQAAAREANPEVFAGLDRTAGKLAEVEQRMLALESQKYPETPGHLIPDGDVRKRFMQLENELDNFPSPEREAEIAAEMNELMSRVDTDGLARAHEAKVSEVSQAARDLEVERRKLKDEYRANLEAADRAMSEAVQNARTARPSPKKADPSAKTPRTKEQVHEELQARAEKLDAEINEELARFRQRLRPVKIREDGPEVIRLGDNTEFSPDTVVNVDGRDRTLSEILEDFDNDDDMVNAVNTCALGAPA